MTQEDKNILLKDLCARLPYHPKINIYNDSWEGCQIGEFDNELWCHHIEAFNCDRIEIKPYLRPMDSMTADEEKEFLSLGSGLAYKHNQVVYNTDQIDWLLKNHIDYRGLIKKGLALKAPDGMYRDKTGETDEPCFEWKEYAIKNDELSEHELRIARHFYKLGLNKNGG